MPLGNSCHLLFNEASVDFTSEARPRRAAWMGSKFQSMFVTNGRSRKVSRASAVCGLLSPMRLYGHTGSRPRFSTLCWAAPGSAELVNTVVPPEVVVG